jgi:hypothetical protein
MRCGFDITYDCNMLVLLRNRSYKSRPDLHFESLHFQTLGRQYLRQQLIAEIHVAQFVLQIGLLSDYPPKPLLAKTINWI